MNTSWYDRHILPHALDFGCGLPMVSWQRQLVVPLAQGRVLVVGIGTGLNMPWYDKTRVTKITGLDPALQLHPLARKRIAKAGLDVALVGLSAEQIPLPDASFDTVLITYTLCTIPNPLAALKEMCRVQAPGGRLLFCEHGRALDESVQRWPDWLQPLWGKLAGSCHLGRDIPVLLQAEGFRLTDLHTRYLPGPAALYVQLLGQSPCSKSCIGGSITIVQGGALRETPAARTHARWALGSDSNQSHWLVRRAGRLTATYLRRQTVFVGNRRQLRPCPRVA